MNITRQAGDHHPQGVDRRALGEHAGRAVDGVRQGELRGGERCHHAHRHCPEQLSSHSCVPPCPPRHPPRRSRITERGQGRDAAAPLAFGPLSERSPPGSLRVSKSPANAASAGPGEAYQGPAAPTGCPARTARVRFRTSHERGEAGMAIGRRSDGAQSGNGTRRGDLRGAKARRRLGPDDAARRRARARGRGRWRACGPTSPSGRRSATRGRARWLYKLRDWLLDHQDEIADTMQAETGKVRGESGGETVYLADLINFYGKRAEKFIGDEKVARALPADEDEEAARPVPPLPGGRRDQPLELPADPLARRRASRAAGRRRGGDQALGGHPARHRRDRRGLEARHRRPRRARRRQRRRRDGLGACGRGRLRPVHGLGPHRQEGAGPGRRDADPGQRRARRQGPDDRAARAPTSRRPPTPPPGARSPTPARSACRSSASTSRSRSTTSSCGGSPTR